MIGILSLMHEDYISANNYNGIKVFQETVDQLTVAFSTIMNSNATIDVIGGGIIGCTFGVLFTSLFSYNGMKIVSWTLCIAGVSLFTGFSIADFVKNTSMRAKEMIPKKEKKVKEEKETSFDSSKKPVITGGEDEVKDDRKVTISNINELTKINTKEEVREEPIKEEVVNKPVIIHNGNYTLPPISILNPVKKNKSKSEAGVVEKNIETLEKVLKDFGVIGKVVEVHIGPTVTQYELELQTGTKLNKVLSIHKEIALVLAAKDIRIEAPIPGKSTVGIEIPNRETTPVSFREVMEKVPASKSSSKLLCPLGKNIMGNVVWCEIDKTPHLLVAGSTGSGKSVCINGIIASILMRTRPDEVKLVMVDPKKVELSVYNGVPHLLCPVVTDPKKAAGALNWAVAEMTDRYNKFAEAHVRNLKGYNAKIDSLPDVEGEPKPEKMPQIVIIVDELADLMMVASNDVEGAICRLAQLARAAGIHLIIATQRPSVNVITGLIKANMPSRIAFAVTSGIDSRTILDMNGAEKLLGKGDMLFYPQGIPKPVRVQGAFVSDKEVSDVVNYIKEENGQVSYNAAVEEHMNNAESENTTVSIDSNSGTGDGRDAYFADAAKLLIDKEKGSIGMLQRYFKVGFNRAARIMDQLEEAGIVGPEEGTKPRRVLMTQEQFEQYEEEYL